MLDGLPPGLGARRCAPKAWPGQSLGCSLATALCEDRKDLLNINAGIALASKREPRESLEAKNIVEACAKFCPEAVLGLIVNPVNSVVPAMCEMWKKKGRAQEGNSRPYAVQV